MSKFKAHDLLIKVFLELQRIGLDLGIGDLLDARRAVAGGWAGDGPEDLRQVLRLLWCQSQESMRDFDDRWAAVLYAATPTAEGSGNRPSQTPLPEITVPEDVEPIGPEPTVDPEGPPPTEQGLSVLPVQVPFSPVTLDESVGLNAYWPVTRRSMSYTWRYLRRMIPTGPEDVLDIVGTVERAARQGFYLAPVFRRRQINYAHLILLLDQGGSMVPFHRFTRDLIETARGESFINDVEVYYFHNVVSDDLYNDSYLTEQVNWDTALSRCDGDTSVLIVSDAGAARGHRRLPRISATAQFLVRLRQHTALVAWLNPMPDTRWPDTSASSISHFVKMYQMDPDGFSSAIDVVRGQQF